MPGTSLNAQQWTFLDGEFLSASIGAALGHSGTYKEELPAKANGQPDKDGPDAVGKAFRTKIVQIAEAYADNIVTGDQHIRNIGELAGTVSKTCPQYLRKDCPRFGVAAKALSLYLKYLWCMGKIKEPPHCPFDRRVIGELHKLQKLPVNLRDLSWTQMDEATYRQLLIEAEKRIGGQSLATWELRAWEDSKQ